MSPSSNPAAVPALEALRVNVIVGRAEKRLSQDMLAERAGVSRPTVSRIERASADVTVSVVQRIADALEMSVSEMFVPASLEAVNDKEIARRLASPEEFADLGDFLAASEEAAGRGIRRYSKAGRPPLAH